MAYNVFSGMLNPAQSKLSAHVCCGQTDGWIKISLGTEVGLGTDDSVLDGDLAPPKRGIRLFIIAGRGPAYSAPPSLK